MIEVIHTLVFGGNPCPVVKADDRLSDVAMQNVAKRFGEDTAIILSPRSKDADIRIRYFVPDHEMGVSGHATIAAVTVALGEKSGESGSLRAETITGTFSLTWARRDKQIIVTLDQNPPEFGLIVPAGDVGKALRCETDEAPIQVVSVSRPKLLIPLRSSKILNDLKPDYEALWKVCDKLQVSGFYPFTRRTDKANVTAEARQFPLRAGFPEDAATGVAAAALAAYLTKYDVHMTPGKHEFRIAQGYAMGSPSLIEAITEVSNGSIVRTAVRGSAQIVGTESIP